MSDTDELAAIRAHLKRIERRQMLASGEADRIQRLLLARLFVVIATVALFLALSMPWYSDVELDGDSAASVSGWRTLLSMLGPDDERTFLFGGLYGWGVLIAAFAGGASVLTLRRRWFAGTLSALLAFLAVLLLAVNMRESDNEKLAGIWCSVAVMVGGAFAWGNLVPALREEETAALSDGGNR